MTIEEEVFQKQRPDFTKLTAAGFTKRKRDYQFEQDFMAGQLRAVVRVDFTDTLAGTSSITAPGRNICPSVRSTAAPLPLKLRLGTLTSWVKLPGGVSFRSPFMVLKLTG